MRTPAVVLTCTAVSLFVSGCDGLLGGGGASGAGKLTATWAMKHADGSDAPCQAGFEKMKVSTDAFLSSLNATDNNPVPTLFDCAAGTGTINLPGGEDFSGKYRMIWEETDSTGETVFATDMLAQLDDNTVADVTSGKATVSTTFFVDGGYAWIEWSLFGTTAGTNLDSCDGAGVDRIDLELTEFTSQAVTHESFPCKDANGRGAVELQSAGSVGGAIKPYKAGQYSTTATAFSGDTAVGTTSSATDITVGDKNTISILPDQLSIDLTNR